MNAGYLPRYIITFGLFQGLWLYITAEWLKHGRISLKSIKHPFSLRSNTSDLLVFREVFLFRSYAMTWQAPKIIIDGGGNIGLAALWFANQFPEAKIYTLEPAPSNFQALAKNIDPYPTITAIPCALWNKNSTLRIRNEDDRDWAFTVEECPPDEPGSFQGITLKRLMEQHQIDVIDILKLDIEGAEREVFMAEYEYWIPRTKCILVELHDWMKPDCSKQVFKTIAQYNFTTTVFNGMLQFINVDLK